MVKYYCIIFFLKENLKLNVRVIALSNSRKMHFQEGGISLKNWEAQLENGEKADKDLFFEKIDNIENDISNGITFDELLNSYNLKSIFEENSENSDESA